MTARLPESGILWSCSDVVVVKASLAYDTWVPSMLTTNLEGKQKIFPSLLKSSVPPILRPWFYLGSTVHYLKRKKERKKVKSLSHVHLFATPWTCSPPGSSVHGIFQARILEWVAISFSKRSSWLRDWTQVSYCRQTLYCLSHQGSLKRGYY